jgi:hypothetical protein
MPALIPSHLDAVRIDLGAARTACRRPGLSGPSLSGSSRISPSLSGPGLSGPNLISPSLSGPSLSGSSRISPSLSGCSVISPVRIDSGHIAGG